MRQILIATLIAAGSAGTASAACNYDQAEPVTRDGQTQHRFFNECGFYEVGYRLDGNTLYFPGGGEHTIEEVSATEAQALLSEVYGLVEVEGKKLIRTKGFFGPPS